MVAVEVVQRPVDALDVGPDVVGPAASRVALDPVAEIERFVGRGTAAAASAAGPDLADLNSEIRPPMLVVPLLLFVPVRRDALLQPKRLNSKALPLLKLFKR